MKEPKPASKIWFETNEGYVFGPGVYNLLKAIKETGTLKEASQCLDMSYRYAWGLIKKAEETLQSPLIEATKGGRRGGGSSKITELGEVYIMDFEKIQKMWEDFKIQYNRGTIINTRIIESEGDLVLRINEDIILEQDKDYSEGDHVKIRLFLA